MVKSKEPSVPKTSDIKPKTNRFMELIDPGHNSIDKMSQLTYEIWHDKYRWGDEKLPSDTFARVCAAIYKDDSEEHQQEAYDAMCAGLWMPGGRIIAGAGTQKRVTLMNCLGAEELVPTQEFGNIPLKEASTKESVTLLTMSGWVKSTVQYFGLQQLNKITLRPSRSKYRKKVVLATSNHRWFTPSGRVITSLYPGILLLSCGARTSNQTPEYEAGLFHGIVFGDGQLHRTTLREVSGGYPLGTFHHVLRACGRVTEYYSVLDKFCTNYKQPDAAKGDRIYYHYGAQNFKTFPDYKKSGDYFAGFIDGWWIADGHYENGRTQRCISSTNYEHLNWLIQNAGLGGYIVTGDKIIGKKVTNLGTAKDPCRAITILPAHKVFWTVESIEPIGVQPVYCAVVPEVHAFCLTEGLYTGNCYVNKTIEDSLDDIMRGVSVAALTQQQGGGIGTDFSTIRPENALLRRTGARASGPLPFMDMWDSMCVTIMSSGDRRGAMMATMCDTHPDLPQFISAKHKKGRLTNFNMSILVSDALMGAVADDEDWVLYFSVPPATRESHLEEMDFEDDDGVQQYVYSVWKARDLWALITKNTYDYSEPGVIFIDRINDLNNLSWIETIRCTNPCGEQPLPPNGTCNLGAINLSRLVLNPFTPKARLDYYLLTRLAKIGMRFLDNVIDVTNYPLLEQESEEKAKRRTGLGVSGLADALAQLGLRYGSAQSADEADRIMKTICFAAYDESISLAEERGSFPFFNAEQYLASNTFARKMLLPEHHSRLKQHGIRNGVLLTVAPTGTTSILYGNISSGIEPVFAHRAKRKVRQPDNSFKEYDSYGYNFWLFATSTHQKFEDVVLPLYMVEAEDLTIESHIVMQAAVQRWVDASVSKTINVSTETTYEQFQKVYELAYTLGCKGCTTYRPSEIRGSILSRTTVQVPEVEKPRLAPRAEVLTGITHKVKWPSMSSALYITVNSDNGIPYEVFFNSKDARFQEWMTALSLMISAILRKGDGDVSFIGQELGAVHSVHDTARIKLPGENRSKWFGSLIAFIGYILEQDFAVIAQLDVGGAASTRASSQGMGAVSEQSVLLGTGPAEGGGDVYTNGERCPSCFAPAIIHSEGCKKCTNCGFSDCN